ncbi:hypothetical protein BKA56DRAFT_615998 [Ilyonectria sp. MPI-CAGE-AT-0026]|nr:hypothetical protein BKA56DRAFT_615998 [Ilyonectria sp. MPI-CAGE-AT-0026]
MGCCCSKDSGSEGTETWPRSVTPSDNAVKGYMDTGNSPRSNYSSASPMSYSMNNQSYPISNQPCSTAVQQTDYTCRGALLTSSMISSDTQSSQDGNSDVQHNDQARWVEGRTFTGARMGGRADDLVFSGMAQSQENQGSVYQNKNPGVQHKKQIRRVESRTFTSARMGRQADGLVVSGMAQSQENQNNGHLKKSFSLSVPEPVYDRRGESSMPIKISRYARLNVDDPVQW